MFTASEVARVMDVSERTVWRWVEAGWLSVAYYRKGCAYFDPLAAARCSAKNKGRHRRARLRNA